MELDFNNLEETLFEIVDEVKVLFSQETWENLLFNCTKNEIFVLILLYRNSDVNMSQIAEYLSIPLNTATGLVSRMEKRKLIQRSRSASDKRVVTILLTGQGNQQIDDILKAYMFYGQKIVSTLEPDEFKMITKVAQKVIEVMKDSDGFKKPETKKVRKITIE